MEIMILKITVCLVFLLLVSVVSIMNHNALDEQKKERIQHSLFIIVLLSLFIIIGYTVLYHELYGTLKDLSTQSVDNTKVLATLAEFILVPMATLLIVLVESCIDPTTKETDYAKIGLSGFVCLVITIGCYNFSAIMSEQLYKVFFSLWLTMALTGFVGFMKCKLLNEPVTCPETKSEIIDNGGKKEESSDSNGSKHGHVIHIHTMVDCSNVEIKDAHTKVEIEKKN